MSSQSVPRVTVICATYNRSNVLPYAIGSVIEQNYKDWELLVVGDACTDDSGEVVERVVRERGEQDRVRWINLAKNARHQYGPNNEGLRQARGELISYIGHDDLWLPHHLDALVEAIDAGADVVHSVAYWANEDGSGVTLWPIDVCDAPSAIMHRRSLTERFGNWRDYREIVDVPQTELWKRLRANGARFQFVERLTSIKIAAGRRPGIYKTLSCHEQQYWQQRIRQEPHLEQKLLTVLVRDTYKDYRKHYVALKATWSYRLRYHLRRLRQGQLPNFKRVLPDKPRPGAFVRYLNHKRGVHDE